MRREFHVRFCEGLGVRFPQATRLQIFAYRVTPRLTAWVSDLVEGRMGLTINVDKTSIAKVVPGGDAADFLGYRFRWERSHFPGGRPWLAVKPSPKSQQRFRDRIGEMTASRRGLAPIGLICAQINRHLSGWVQSFGAFHRGHIFNKADGFVRDRMPRHLKRRSQRGVRPTQGTSWYSHIREKLGVCRFSQLRPSKASR